jgi:hypothetical protein
MENLVTQETKELVIVKQLPVIEQHLQKLATEIDAKVELAKNLVCTEDTVKDVKNVRASLTKQFKELEESRKEVKSKIMTPYEQFEKVYKECVSDKFKKADADLKTKVDEVENTLKAEKEKEVEDYFTELLTANNIDFVYFRHANINVTLSASMKSLKEQARTFVDKIVSDLQLIDTQDHKDEILFEYKVCLDVSKAILIVKNRIEALEEQKAKEDERKQREEKRKAEMQAEKPVEKTPLQAPMEVKKEPILKMRFTVEGTKAQLVSVKEFLEREGIKYE